MEKAANSFRELIVWKKAHQLVLSIYRITKTFPADERFGLASQMRRAAVSVAANIAEGFAKRGRLDKMRYLNIAQGSLEEVHYYLILGDDLGYCESGQLLDAYQEAAKLLSGYSRAILNSNS